MIQSSSFSFTIEGRGVPKGRPRAAVRGKFVSFYTPKKTVEFEKKVRMAALQYLKRGLPKFKPVNGQVLMTLNFFFKRAKTVTGTPHTARPDLDNLVKAVLDGLNGVLFEDDSQVFMLVASKRYAKQESIEVIFTGDHQDALSST